MEQAGAVLTTGFQNIIGLYKVKPNIVEVIIHFITHNYVQFRNCCNFFY